MKQFPIITLGSPYGIGYEIFLLALANEPLFAANPLVVCGSFSIMQYYQKLLEIPANFEIIPYTLIKNSGRENLVFIDIDSYPFEIESPDTIAAEMDAEIALKSIDAAIELVERNLFSSVVTLPVSKERINLIDASFKGHTEYFQKKWHADKVYMTFVSDELIVLLLTTHISLKEVPQQCHKESIDEALHYADQLAKKLGRDGEIVLLGLNPHAGEGGLLGNEELEFQEVIAKHREKGVAIKGPMPADTAFLPWVRKQTSVYIAHYHDQGLIPFKMLAFDSGVNLSFGMPYIRTSVDHGTAVDLIGKKTANINSFIAAYNLAIKLTDV